jgi:hypothetical protein
MLCVLLHSVATCSLAAQLLQFTHARFAYLSVLVALKRPARHVWHVASAPGSVPTSQTHSTCPVRRSVVLPAAHAWHDSEPVVFVTELGGHLIHSRFAVVFL